jgi:hypothetical protein
VIGVHCIYDRRATDHVLAPVPADMRASALQPLLVLSVCAAAIQAATVSLHGTRLLGRDIPSLRQEFFAGIPYAQPPVGSLRLRPPVLKRSLKQTAFNATNYGPACIQTVRVDVVCLGFCR